MFKDPLERLDQRGGPILNHEDIKSIFGNIPEILSVHRHLVVRPIRKWDAYVMYSNTVDPHISEHHGTSPSSDM